MIDFIRCSTPTTSMSMLDRIGHRVIEPVDKRTMDSIAPLRCKVENIKCKQSKRSGFTMSGSLHKYLNRKTFGEDQNHNDFSLEKVCEAIHLITEDTGLEPDSTYIHSMEFGVNIDPGMPACELLNNHIVSLGTKSPIRRINQVDYNLMKFGKTEKTLKLYDTALKHGLEDMNLLRVELKFNKARQIKKVIGVEELTLALLMEKDTYIHLKSCLLSVFDDLLILDTLIPKSTFTADQIALFNLFANSKIWEQSKNPYSPSQKYRMRQKFCDLVQKSDLLQTKNRLEVVLNDKLNYLIAMQ